ncbi:MAG: hypothetical protein JEZ05_11035 [Tenericutes bacterium]|nr:hypothetical protein [Mycoplasmatota bacterium]
MKKKKKNKNIGINLSYKARYFIGIICGMIYVGIGDCIHYLTTLNLADINNIWSYLIWTLQLLIVFSLAYMILYLVKKRIYIIFNKATLLICLLTINIIMAIRLEKFPVFTAYLTVIIIVYNMVDEYQKNTKNGKFSLEEEPNK